MKFFLVVNFTLFFFVTSSSLSAQDRRQFEAEIALADQTPVSIVIVDDADREAEAQAIIEHVFTDMRQLELLIRETIARIEAGNVNEPIPLSPPAFAFLRKALDLSALTNGWFDIAAPSPRSLFTKRDWRRIVLDETNHTITLLSRRMKFDVRWLLHGIAVDTALAAMVQNGIMNARVTVGGVSRFIGRDIFSPWGLSLNLAPTGDQRLASRAYAYGLSSAGVSTITAGDAKLLVDAKSKRPVVPTFQSITIVASEAATAAGFAQALTSFAPPIGFVFLQAHASIKGMIVDRNGHVLASPTFIPDKESP